MTFFWSIITALVVVVLILMAITAYSDRGGL